MPAKDTDHATVRQALLADGWTITHDPFRLRFGRRAFSIDLGAEQLLAADKAGRKIAVEIKSFNGASLIADLEQALGQPLLYQTILRRLEPDRLLYLAVDRPTFVGIFAEPIGQALLADAQLRLLVFDQPRERIVQWIPNSSVTARSLSAS